MPAPELSAAPSISIPTPPSHTPQHDVYPDRTQQVPTYPSLAYPPAGPSHHVYPTQAHGHPHAHSIPPTGPGVGGWGYQPYYSNYPPQAGAGQRPPPNVGGYGQPPYNAYGQFPYPPQYYPPYGQIPLPGPGPGTMQNGYYGGVPGGGVGDYGQRGYQGYPNGRDARDGVDESGFQANGGSHGGYAPQQQSFYPPNHPYAYGGGIGYQPFPSAPNPGGGPAQLSLGVGNGGYPPDNYGEQHQQHSLPTTTPILTSTPAPSSVTSKALNPAAQGFTYIPSLRKPNLVNGTTHPHINGLANGNGTGSSVSGSAPSMSSAPSIKSESLETPAPTVSGLGLSLNTTEAAQPTAAQAIAPVPEPSAPTPVVQPASLPEPEPEPEPEPAATTVVKLASPAPTLIPVDTPTTPPYALKALTFTGATVAGYTSPPQSSSASSRKSTFEPSPLVIRPSRPDLHSSGNSYAAHLAENIPATILTSIVPGVSRRRSAQGSSKPQGKPVFAAGVAGGIVAPALSLVFGTIVAPPEEPAPPPVESKDAEVIPSVSASAGATEVVATGPISVPSVATVPSLPVAIAPSAEAPRQKPSSWAALLRPVGKSKSTGSPDSLSIATSTVAPSTVSPSTLPSPSKSTNSLPSEAPSRAPQSPEGPTTPRSTAPSLPASSSGPAPAQPRPAFNYAAAAAAGTALTPAEDLARLLSEGLRPKAPHTPAAVVPRGLINTGNMCFANTILQVLVYCMPFTELLEELGKRLKADLAHKTPLLETMIVFMREFAPGPSANGGSNTPKGKGRDNSKDAFVPESVYDAMKENKRFDSMRRGYQEDAEEYLGFFLNTLHEELLHLYSRTLPPRTASKQSLSVNADVERRIDRPVSPGAGGGGGGDDDWLEVGKKQRTHVVRTAESRESAVSRIFGGSLRSVLHAPGQKDSVTLEPYQPLQLDVQAPQVLTIVDALRHLNEPEIVPGVWSAARGANVDATKQVYIESFPPVLILHLKRFVYDGLERSVVKRSKPVAYATELVIPQEIISPAKRSTLVKYRLFGVVYHHGYSATGGHYTVAVARPDGTGWTHFDDELVTSVGVESVIVSEEEAKSGRAGLVEGREKCAYLLFYQRVR